MKTCPNCKTEVPDYAAFCSKCWTKLEIMVKEEKPAAKKEDFEVEIKKEVLQLSLPAMFELDTYIKISAKQERTLERLEMKVKDTIAQWGEAAPGIETYVVLGNAYLAMGRYEKANEYYNYAIRIDGNRKDALHNKGIALYRLGRYKDASEYFDKVLKLDASLASTWYAKGMALMYIGKLQEGARCYDRAIKIDPSLAKRAKWTR